MDLKVAQARSFLESDDALYKTPSLWREHLFKQVYCSLDIWETPLCTKLKPTDTKYNFKKPSNKNGKFFKSYSFRNQNNTTIEVKNVVIKIFNQLS